MGECMVFSVTLLPLTSLALNSSLPLPRHPFPHFPPNSRNPKQFLTHVCLGKVNDAGQGCDINALVDVRWGSGEAGIMVLVDGWGEGDPSDGFLLVGADAVLQIVARFEGIWLNHT